MDRQTKLIASNLFSALLAVIGFLLILAISHDFQKSIDLTSDGRHSFSEQTEALLGSLDRPVTLYAFVDPMGDSSTIEGLLERYRRLNPRHFTFRIVDLQKNPTLAEQLEVRGYGQGVMTMESQLEQGAPDLESSPDSGEPQLTPPRRERLFTFDEANITNALSKLLRTEEKAVYFIVGHSERRPDSSEGREMSQLAQALRSEGYRPAALNLAESGTLPEDADLLVMAGPRGDLLAAERKLVDDYLQSGGKLLFLTDVGTPDSYVEWLQGYGIAIGTGVIIDETSALVGAEPVTPIGASYSPDHPITERFQSITAYTLARPVAVADASAWTEGQPRLETLVRTRESAYLLDLEAVRTQDMVEFSSEGQDPQAFPLAVAGLYPLQPDPDSPPLENEETGAAPPPAPPSSRIVAFGSVETFTNASLSSADNRNLILNCLNWLGESESQIVMRVVDPKSQPLLLEKQKQRWFEFFFLLLLPFLTALTGLLIAMQRRKGLSN